jgi:hypothetical protein
VEAVLAAKVGDDLHKEDKEAVADNLEERRNMDHSLACSYEGADHFDKLLGRGLDVRLRSWVGFLDEGLCFGSRNLVMRAGGWVSLFVVTRSCRMIEDCRRCQPLSLDRGFGSQSRLNLRSFRGHRVRRANGRGPFRR